MSWKCTYPIQCFPYWSHTTRYFRERSNPRNTNKSSFLPANIPFTRRRFQAKQILCSWRLGMTSWQVNHLMNIHFFEVLWCHHSPIKMSFQGQPWCVTLIISKYGVRKWKENVVEWIFDLPVSQEDQGYSHMNHFSGGTVAFNCPDIKSNKVM